MNFAVAIVPNGTPYERVVKLNGIAVGWIVATSIRGGWKAVNQDNELVANECPSPIKAAFALIEPMLPEAV